MNQLTDTSIIAGDKIKYTASEIKMQILDALKFPFVRGATSDELAEHLKIAYKNVQPRCSDLRRDKYIIDSGIRRSNEDGNPVIVWIIES